MQEFLASFAVKIDEAGVNRLQSVLSENRELAEQLAAAFDGASAAIRSFSEELGILPGFSGFDVPVEETAGPGRLPVGLDLAQAFSDYESFTALVKQPVSLKANASGIVSAARSAMGSIRSIFSDPVEVKLKANSELRIQNSALTPAGGGNRNNSELRIQNSELLSGSLEHTNNSGTGFVKSELMSEIRGDLNASRMSLVLSEIPKAGEAGAGSISHYSQNVSAPVNIHVTAAGSDPEQIGRSLYDTAERYLLRTLQSAKG